MKNYLRKMIAGIQRYGLLRAVRGLTTFARFVISKPHRGQIATRTDDLHISFNYPSQFMPTLVIFREFVEPEFEFLRRILQPDAVFFDVGGGIGAYSLTAARFCSGPIYIFEPLQENVSTIKENLQANNLHSQVTVNEVALSDLDGYGRMHTEETLFVSKLGNTFDDNQDGSVKVVKLDTYCLENHIEHIDVIKIDVEGHEEKVIEGAKALLQNNKVDILILEINPSLGAFYSSLEKRGFTLFFYDYRANSLVRFSPFDYERVESAMPSVFHSNIILIRNELTKSIEQRLSR